MDPPTATGAANSIGTVPQQNAANGQGGGKIEHVQQQMDDVKVVMSENVTRILERGERLENLDQQSAALQESAQVFTHTSNRVQRAFWLRNMKWTIIFVLFMLAVLVILVLTVLKLVKAI